MKFPAFLPLHLRFSLVVTGLHLVLFVFFRLIFLGLFWYQASEIGGSTLLQSFYLGFKFDLRLALLTVVPVVLLAWIPGLEITRFWWVRALWQLYLVLAGVGLMWFYLADLGHYAYLNARINSTVLQFLATPKISAAMVWESYPVIWMGLGLVLFAMGYRWLLARLTAWIIRGKPGQSFFRAPLWKRGLATVVCFFLLLLGLYGKLGYYPLRWSEAFFTPQPFAVALGLNPVLYFYDTLKNTRKDFDLEEARRVYPLMAGYLGVDKPDPATLNFDRNRVPESLPGGKPNVVIIILESFSSYKVGALGNPLPATPRFDALAKDGVLFTNFFTPTTGTARSIFASLFGIPDITFGTTATYNPLTVNQHTIIDGFRDYDKMYFIGGSANWRNIRGVLSHNIKGLRIYEEEDYDRPHNDVWGISDLHLFLEANERLAARESGQPFFAVIQTAGNHRPYTIPEDSGGYRMLDPGVKDLNPVGFISVEEFNSFRFLDHTLGVFFDHARKAPYFDNTVFFIYGDHGVPGFANHLPQGINEHQLTQHGVPFLIYGPGIIKAPARIDTIVSQLDVVPTIAAVTGTPYKNTTLGRNMFQKPEWDKHYAFVYIPYVNPGPIGLLDREWLFKIESNGEKKLFQYRSPDYATNQIHSRPDIANVMEEYAQGFFQTARYLLYNNPTNKAQ